MSNKIILETLICIAIIIIYDIVLVRLFKKFFVLKKKVNITYLFIILFEISWIIFRGNNYVPAEIAFIIKLSVWTIFIRYIFKISSVGALYCNFVSEFYLLCVGEIILTSLAIIGNTSCESLIDNNRMYIFIYIVSRSINIILLEYIIKKVNDYKDVFRNTINKKQLIKITVSQFVLTLFIVIIQVGYELELNPKLYLIMLTILIFINYTYSKLYFQSIVKIDSIKNIEKESEVLLRQLKIQKMQFKDLEKDILEAKRLNHDYKKIIRAIDGIIENYDEDKLKNFLSKFKEEIKEKSVENKDFSNNVFVNAIINDVNKECKKENISLEGKIYIPENIKLEDIDTIRLFNNIFYNALEANLRIKNKENRYIKFSSSVNKGWILIQIQNSFNGDLKYSEGKIKSVKERDSRHGNGINIIKNIAETNGIIFKIEPNFEKKNFAVKLILKKDD